MPFRAPGAALRSSSFRLKYFKCNYQKINMAAASRWRQRRVERSDVLGRKFRGGTVPAQCCWAAPRDGLRPGQGRARVSLAQVLGDEPLVEMRQLTALKRVQPRRPRIPRDHPLLQRQKHLRVLVLDSDHLCDGMFPELIPVGTFEDIRRQGQGGRAAVPVRRVVPEMDPDELR